MKRLVLSKSFKKIIKEATTEIKRGEAVVCPTDTVYGLICDATSEAAIRLLFKIKKRPLKKPIPVFVKDIKMAKNLALINKKQERFLKRVWPGKVTVVLKAQKTLPRGVVGSDNTIGLRIPDHKLVSILLKKTKVPLSGTSANISGKPASTKIREVMSQLKKEKVQPNLIIDAGNLEPAKPSTVVDLTKSRLKILRAGEIKKEKLVKYFQ